MKKSLVITDLTRMQEGRVCVAGYDQKGGCIRPVLPPPGIHESMLYAGKLPIVYPFAIIEYDFFNPCPQPPHIEDCLYDPASVRFVRKLDEKERLEVLKSTLFSSTQELFDVPIQSIPGYYIYEGEGKRSLGTIYPCRITKVIYEQSLEGKYQYRLGFVDGKGDTYWLTITDLAWRYYCDYQYGMGIDPSMISSQLSGRLHSSQVYLRLGLSRGWKLHPGKCFLQITGVYTFPDYLEGRIFADYAPKS